MDVTAEKVTASPPSWRRYGDVLPFKAAAAKRRELFKTVNTTLFVG